MPALDVAFLHLKFELNRRAFHTNQNAQLNLSLYVIQAIFWEFRTGLPLELLYTDDLLVIADSGKGVV